MQLTALGERIVVDTSVLPDSRRRELAELWERCFDATDADGRSAHARPPADIVLATSDVASLHPAPRARSVDVTAWEGAPYRLSRAVTRVALGKATGRHLLFHAAAVALPNGSVLVLVGPSGAGKTTAATALGRSYGYVTDESVAIRSDASVAAYPKPLSVIGSSRYCRKMEISPSDAGLLQASEPLRLGRVVLLARDPQHTGPPDVEPVDLLDAVTTASVQTSGLVALEQPLQRLAESLVTLGPAVRLRYREISDCVNLVPELMDEQPIVERPRWTHHPVRPLDPTEEQRGGATQAGAFPAWKRAPYVDAIDSAGRVVVLHDHNITLLDGVGASTWLAASNFSTMEELVVAASFVHGPHPDPQSRVVEAVAQLEQAGLLLRLSLSPAR